MKKSALALLIAPLCFCSSATLELSENHNATNGSDQSALEIINKIFSATDSIKTLKFTFNSKERVEGKMISMQSRIKLQFAPRKLYLDCIQAELLWWEGVNNDEAYVHPYGFPYFNVNLDPDNSFLRKGQHHSIRETGFNYLINILRVNSITKRDQWVCLNSGEEKINDRLCFKLTLSNPDFGFTNYTVKKKETMINIARKLNVSEYMILENNPKFSSYTSIGEGDVIKVPTVYAKMTVLHVDQQNYLPMVIKVYDHKGLFEHYEYTSLRINPVIADVEFTKDCKEYNF